MATLEDNFTELNNELADLYPFREDIIRIVRDGGLKPGEINWNGTALRVWSQITIAAKEKGRSLQLVLSALNGYDHNPVLTRYLDLFQEQGRELSRNISVSGSIMPELAHQLDRPAEVAKLKKLLLEKTSERVGVTGKASRVGVEGMGGIGKTVLATMLVNDPQIKKAFPDGIIWQTIGQTPSLIQLQSQVLQSLGEAGAFTDLNQGKNRLDELWQTRKCLLVLDDVWETEHALVFGNPGQKSRVLLTTRKIEVVKDLGAKEYPLGLLSKEEARKLLAEWSGLEVIQLPATASKIVEECGRLPLAIANCGGMVRGAPADMWQAVLEALQSADLVEISRKFPGYPYPDLVKAIQVSVDELENEDQNAYLDLAVFPEDTPIPSDVLKVLWKSNNIAALRRMKLFADRSLAKWDEGGRLTLHDLQYDYIRKVREPVLVSLHRRLVESYRERCQGEWWESANDSYLYDFLGYHLKEAGLIQELRGLLYDYRWLQAKLNSRGIYALISDYNQLPPQEEDTQLVVGSLRLGAHVLAKDPSQLASQLAGRLGSFEQSSIRLLLTSTHLNPSLKLRLCSTSLEPPGGPLLRTFEGHTKEVNGVAVLPDGKHFVSASEDETLKLWEVESGQEVRTFKGHIGEVTGVTVLPDGKYFVSSSNDRTLKLWEVESGQEVRTFRGHIGEVTGVTVLPDGKYFVSASYDKTLKLWEVESGQEVRTFKGHTKAVSGVAVLPDGKHFVSASYDKTLKLWEASSGQEVRTFNGHTEAIFGVAVLPDGKYFVSASYDRTLKLWEVESGQEVRTFKGRSSLVTGVAVLPDGKYFVSASEDKTLKLWEVESGQEVHTFKGRASSFTGVAVLPDGKHFVSASYDKTLKLWEVESGQEVRTFKGHTEAVTEVVVLPDGKYFVSASADRTLKLWEVSSGQEVRTFKGHTDRISSVAAFSDGKHFVSASYDKTLKLWEVGSKQVVATFSADAPLLEVNITSDSNKVVVGDREGRLHFLELIQGKQSYTKLNEQWKDKAMPDNTSNQALKQILADNFYLNKDIIDIIQEAGIKPQLIDLEGKAANVWSNVLHYAFRNNKVPAILKAALNMQPDNQELKTALEASLNTTSPTPDHTGNSKVSESQTQATSRQHPLTFEELSNFVNLLLACPSLSNPGSRSSLVGMLPANIRQAINYSPQASARQEVFNIVQTCQNFPNGLSELLKIVAFFDKGTIAFQELEQFAREIDAV